MEENKNSSRTGISFRNYHITIDTYDIKEFPYEPLLTMAKM